MNQNDTLTLFKTVLPLREKYSQESLVSDVLGISCGAHDSFEMSGPSRSL